MFQQRHTSSQAAAHIECYYCPAISDSLADHKLRVILLPSSAEAADNAIKIARSYTGRQNIIAFDVRQYGSPELVLCSRCCLQSGLLRLLL